MLRRSFGVVLVVAVVTSGTPALAGKGPIGQFAATGQIGGTVRDSMGLAMPNTGVRLRNIESGELGGSTTTNGGGQFAFVGLGPGMYVAEVVNPDGNVIAASRTISLAAGAMAATGVAVTAPAVEAAQPGAGRRGVGAFFGSTAGIITIAAVAGGVAFGIYEATRPSASSAR